MTEQRPDRVDRSESFWTRLKVLAWIWRRRDELLTLDEAISECPACRGDFHAEKFRPCDPHLQWIASLYRSCPSEEVSCLGRRAQEELL